MMRWLRGWWARAGWQPDDAGQDRRVEALRTQAIRARVEQERARVLVGVKVRSMRESIDAAYRAAEEARKR